MSEEADTRIGLRGTIGQLVHENHRANVNERHEDLALRRVDDEDARCVARGQRQRIGYRRGGEEANVAALTQTFLYVASDIWVGRNRQDRYPLATIVRRRDVLGRRFVRRESPPPTARVPSSSATS